MLCLLVLGLKTPEADLGPQGCPTSPVLAKSSPSSMFLKTRLVRVIVSTLHIGMHV